MHYWGDEWFDKHGDDLYTAQRYISTHVKRYSRCNLISKEKYGTIRYEYILPPYGALFIRNRVHRYWLHCYLYRVWTGYGWWTTLRAVENAIEKWPHLEAELMQDLACNEELVGKEIHDKYWTSL